MLPLPSPNVAATLWLFGGRPSPRVSLVSTFCALPGVLGSSRLPLVSLNLAVYFCSCSIRRWCSFSSLCSLDWAVTCLPIAKSGQTALGLFALAPPESARVRLDGPPELSKKNGSGLPGDRDFSSSRGERGDRERFAVLRRLLWDLEPSLFVACSHASLRDRGRLAEPVPDRLSSPSLILKPLDPR